MLFLEKSCDRNFIGRVQNSGKRAAGFTGAPGQIERRKIVVTRPANSSSASFPKSSGGSEFGTRSGQVMAY